MRLFLSRRSIVHQLYTDIITGWEPVAVPAVSRDVLIWVSRGGCLMVPMVESEECSPVSGHMSAGCQPVQTTTGRCPPHYLRKRSLPPQTSQTRDYDRRQVEGKHCEVGWVCLSDLYCEVGYHTFSILSWENHLTGCSSVKIMSSIKLQQADKLYWMPDYYSVVLDHF